LSRLTVSVSFPSSYRYCWEMPPPPPAIDCDDFAVLRELARTGAGVAVLPLHVAAADVAEGALVRVVGGVTLRGAPLFVVTRPERPLPPRVAALRDHLLREIPPTLAVRR